MALATYCICNGTWNGWQVVLICNSFLFLSRNEWFVLKMQYVWMFYLGEFYEYKLGYNL